ncbi:hypothetical protein DCD74_08275 [Lysobacter oculi]|uniref:Thiol:disulfide interchange protein n=1 Tax=Solilutibacter oculi TaxID=2698682 RepID=A0A344J6M1_9GAMM|nr:DsbC family protein [Lysobacter oculi]AXA84681.1 hypothetical protein DCD74_08275 [Lysobacter oculi]
MKKALLTAVLGGMSLVACAQGQAPAADKAAAQAAPPAVTGPMEPKVAAGSADANAIAAIRKLNSQVQIDKVGPAPLPGFREVVVGGQVVYVSEDGRYLMQGALMDMQTKRDLAQQALASVRKDLLAQVPKSDRIVFAPANPKYTVSVFTDVECGYCRKLHSDIAEYNRQGIAVEYLAFPRMGPGSEDFAKMEAVWCSNDRRKALTDAKNGKSPQAARCTSPVMRQYDIGRRAGLAGTPLIIAENGLSPPGYLPPAELRRWLDQNAAAK